MRVSTKHSYRGRAPGRGTRLWGKLTQHGAAPVALDRLAALLAPPRPVPRTALLAWAAKHRAG